MSTYKPNRQQDIRRINLRNLAAQYGASNLAKMAGYKGPSWISQMVGPKADRTISDETAAKVEQALNLAKGWMDIDHYMPQGIANAKPGLDNLFVLSKEENERLGGAIDHKDALRVVYRAMDKHGVSPGIEQFVIISRVMMRDMEHTGEFNDDLFSDLLILANLRPADPQDP
jgi:hypothetical protein